MKQIGNLAIVCAKRRNVLLQVLNGMVTVHIGCGLEKNYMTTDWQDDNRISEIIHELNFGKYAEGKEQSI
jgi:hypothetical protein